MFRARRTEISAAVLALLVVAAAGAAWAPVRAADPAPHTLAIRVAHDGPGFDTFRQDLQFRVVAVFDAAHCFERVVVLDPRATPPLAAALGAGADLLLDIVVSGIEDELEYDISMAERNDPRAPPDVARQRIARFDVDVAMTLMTLDDGVPPLRDRRFHAEGAHRPLLDEDPRLEAQLEAVDEIARSAERLGCKGGPRKLERRIREVRSEPAGRH